MSHQPGLYEIHRIEIYIASSQGAATAFQIWSGSTPTISTGATGLQRLDYIICAAQARGIRLIIPFVNNWGDYGGIKIYVDALASSQGDDASSPSKMPMKTTSRLSFPVIRLHRLSLLGSWPMSQGVLVPWPSLVLALPPGSLLGLVGCLLISRPSTRTTWLPTELKGSSTGLETSTDPTMVKRVSILKQF